MAKSMQQIIQDAINQQNALLSGASARDWRKVLIPNGSNGVVPPIVWFGDTGSEKPKVVTIGVNPSDREFCDGKGNLLSKSRINLSFNIVPLENSYNDYFKNNPYASWFGKKGKVEGFLNGMHASYYDKQKYEFQAIHIDLFPFATNPTYTRIQGYVGNDIVGLDLFTTNWTKNSVIDLITTIDPEYIIIFGQTNINCFQNAVEKVNNLIPYSWTRGKLSAKYSKGKISTGHTIILLDTYLGNPMRFCTSDLNNLGAHVYANLP